MLIALANNLAHSATRLFDRTSEIVQCSLERIPSLGIWDKSVEDDPDGCLVELSELMLSHVFEGDASGHFIPFSCPCVVDGVGESCEQCKASPEAVEVVSEQPSLSFCHAPPCGVDKGEVSSVHSDAPCFVNGDEDRPLG